MAVSVDREGPAGGCTDGQHRAWGGDNCYYRLFVGISPSTKRSSSIS